MSLTPNQFDVLWREPYADLIMDMDIVLEGLRTKYRPLLLSNVEAYYWRTVRDRHPELRHFDSILLSCELGLAKPNRQIFAYATATAGVVPADCFIVDDKLEHIEAARSCGFNTHLINGIPGLRTALRCVPPL